MRDYPQHVENRGQTGWYGRSSWREARTTIGGRVAAAVHRAQTAAPSTSLLVGLLLTDGVLFLLHVLADYTSFVADPAFQLGWEQGYAEIFQYVKMAVIVGMLILLARRRKTAVHLHWIALFAYLLLDDAFMIHETVGEMLATGLALPALLGARGQDWGELLVYVGTGLFFLTTLAVTYQRSDRRARELSQYLFLLMAGLFFFGVGLDVLQHAAGNEFLFRALGGLEDGGEHLMITLTLWFLFLWATPVLSWEARAAVWVRTAAVGTALFLLLLVAFSFVQYGAAGLAGNDGYYHAKMGWLMRQQGLKPAPPQLPLTILNEQDFHNHHFLYHAYLAFFAADDPVADGGRDLTQRAKQASVLLAAAALTAVWWLLRRQKVPWAFLWTVALLAASPAFLYRLSMPRAHTLSLLLLLVGLHWLLHGRYRRLLPLGFLFVWAYNAFPLLLVVAGATFVSVLLLQRRAVWPALLYPAAGIVLGLLINPYFPQNIAFVTQHIGAKLWLSETAVGSEWYPYETWALVQNSGAALAAVWLGTLALAWRRQRLDVRTMTLFLLTAVFGLMLLRSRRFVEYFPAFAIVFTAFALSPLLATWRQERPWLRLAVPPAVVLLLMPLLWHTLDEGHRLMARSAPPGYFAEAALWLNEYGAPDSVVFQTDWDDFPRLFFYLSDAAYTVGLDPTYMEQHDADLFRTWVQITRGEADDPGALIAGRFGADYVFSDLYHDAFLQQAAADERLTEIYRDGDAVIFQVER